MEDLAVVDESLAASDKAQYLMPGELRIGIFVVLDIPWFKHNFAFGSFRISTEDQLRDVRSLGLPRYRYRPERSDMPDAAGADIPKNSEPVTLSAVEIEADDAVETEQQRNRELLNQQKLRIARIERAFSGAQAVVKNLNRNLLSSPQQTLEQMDQLVSEMVSAFLECPDATLHVMDGNAGGEEVYQHSLNVSILAMMLAKGLEFSAEMAREMGAAAILHDIGLMKVPDRVVKKASSECSAAEKNFRAMHVEYGAEIGRQIGLSDGILKMLEQHHEMADGSGYPAGLTADRMSPAARIISLVNHYDNLCNPVDIAQAMTPHEALSFMFARQRNKFDARALPLLIKSLGVYPPGSIVQLSDQSFAAVMSINPDRALRPTVLIYSEHVSKDEAPLIDLAQVPELSILKAVRPGLLPPKVAAYLNPRQRVTYFFDNSNSQGSR